jgi:hypothetical protein
MEAMTMVTTVMMMAMMAMMIMTTMMPFSFLRIQRCRLTREWDQFEMR